MICLFTALFLRAEASSRAFDFGLETGVPGQEIFVASDLVEWDAHHPQMKMTEISAGSYRLSIPAPWTPELQYQFVIDGKRWILDPRNPRTKPNGHGGLNSVLVHFYERDPWLLPHENIEPWFLDSFFLTDPLGRLREVKWFHPEVSRHPRRHWAFVYFQDGDGYLSHTGVRNLLPRVSAGHGMPIVTGVFISPVDRRHEYAMTAASDALVHFLADQVVPAIEGRVPHPERSRLILGASLGGLFSLYATLKRPEVFPWVAAQSGSFWVNPSKLKALMRKTDATALRFFLDAGIYEDSDILGSQSAICREAEVHWRLVRCPVYPSKHDWAGWENRLRETLHFFFAVKSPRR